MNATQTRYIVRCKKCRLATSTLASRVNYADMTGDLVMHRGSWCIKCRGCGCMISAQPVRGIVNAAVKCNAKCEESVGCKCECSCGGKNHGASHAA